MKLAVATTLLFSASSAFAAAPAAPQPDREQLQQVVDTFRLAIINKDKPAFMALLYSDTIPWLGVTTDNSVAMIKARGFEQKKVTVTGNAVKFIDGIVSDSAPVEEKFDRLRIDTNGDIAQVYFDYSFNRGDYQSNWGQEAWQLVRTGDGWKINSVIWSMEFNPQKPPKKTQ